MRTAIFAALLLSLVACQSRREAEKRAARERFEKGSVVAPVERGAEVDVTRAARDPVEMEKAHLLEAPAVAARLGSFRFRGSTEYRASRGKRREKLAEKIEWLQARDGAFATRLENSRGYGVETWWVQSRFYLRQRWGEVRERPVEAREYLKYPADAWGAWGAVYRLFKGQLKFSEAEPVTVAGRRAVRFEIALSDVPLTRVAESMRQQPDRIDLGDIKVATAQRRRWRRAARPVSAQGTVDLDAATGVPLAVEFRGRLDLPDEEARTELQVTVRTEMDRIGEAVTVAAPESATPEPTMRKLDSRRFSLIDAVRIEDFLVDRWEFPNEKGAQPKTGVTWRQARDACRALGKRLCTLKEWQKACNGDRPRNRYPYGRMYNPERCNTEGTGPQALGERKDCRGDHEIFDLSGNVAEWVESRGKDDQPEWCVAGGAFDDREKARCTRCVPRSEIGEPDERIGFRCCR